MKYKKIITLSIGIPILLGGCINLDVGNHDKNGEKTEANSQAEYNQNLISVQDYTGQGYELDGGEETTKIAEAHREEIEKAVKTFFLDKYKTKVKVHHIVGALNAASVFVESEGEPHFHTYAVVPIDVEKQEVKIDKVWSEEGQVEDAIRTGIYAMVYDKEFKVLDQYLKEFSAKHNLVGLTKEAVENVGGSGYSTPYYYISMSPGVFSGINLSEMYLEKPDRSKKEWEKILINQKMNEKSIDITIQLFLENKNVEPDPSIIEQISKDIKKMDGLPLGIYSVLLHDNMIGKQTARGSKDNSLDSEEIIKDK
ncbi:DUF1672 family protein [Bacillus sp. z60-18]